jgi:hypothetical protein
VHSLGLRLWLAAASGGIKFLQALRSKRRYEVEEPASVRRYRGKERR